MGLETAKIVKLTLNGQEISVPAGTLLIEAAQRAGVQIPHFCYHPKLKSDANCRMCLVEIEKMPKLQTACTTPVAEGMVVQAGSQNVVEARNGVMEFILLTARSAIRAANATFRTWPTSTARSTAGSKRRSAPSKRNISVPSSKRR